jgi:hypothetical protein
MVGGRERAACSAALVQVEEEYEKEGCACTGRRCCQKCLSCSERHKRSLVGSRFSFAEGQQ